MEMRLAAGLRPVPLRELLRQVESVQKIYKKTKGVFRVTLLWATKQIGSRNTENEAIEARFGNVL